MVTSCLISTPLLIFQGQSANKLRRFIASLAIKYQRIHYRPKSRYLIPASKMGVENALSSTETIQQKRAAPNRELKFFKRYGVQRHEKMIPNFDKESKKILLCGKNVTPKPLQHPQLENHLDGEGISIKKMEVEILPPASKIIPVEEVLSSKDFVQYYHEEQTILLEGTAVHQFLQSKQLQGQEEKGLQLMRNITLDELAKDIEFEMKTLSAKEEDTSMIKIDDFALQKHHEYEDLPENKILIQLQQSKTLCLLEIKSVIPNKIAKHKNMTKYHNDKGSSCNEEYLAAFGEKPMIDFTNEKETQTLLPHKSDEGMLTTIIKLQESGAIATNATTYDDIKEHEDREERILMDKINKQKKRLKDLLLDPFGPFREDLYSVLNFLKFSYSEMESLKSNIILLKILEFIKEVEDNYNEKENDFSKNFAVCWETKNYKKNQIFLERVVLEEEVKAIKELKEFSSNLENLLKISPENEYKKITKSENFLLALQALEDILIYKKEFPAIKKYFYHVDETEKYSRRELHVGYNLKFLWEFSDEDSSSQAVKCIAWSENNSGLFAAGYGKLQYENNPSKSGPGYLLIWSVILPNKRPVWKLSFTSSVESICFHPNSLYCLAIGLSNGDVIISDISNQTTEASCIFSVQSANLYGPVYGLSWFRGVGDESDQENMFLVSGGKKGALYQWKRSKEYLISEKILSLPPVYGKIKGILNIEPERKLPCHFRDTSVTCIAKCIKGCTENNQVNEENIPYLVATDDGCIHKCSLEYHHHHHLDYLRAHNGPINSLAVNYFSDQVFLTCGADFSVHIWALGVQYPLITLSHEMECIECAAWSTSHPTIIASISGNILYIWDIQRKTRDPVNKFQNPKNHQLTSVSFSLEGKNILIGDIDGNLLVYHVENLPIVPHFPEKVLVHAIKQAIVYNKSLVKELESTGPPFEDDKMIEKIT